MSKQIRAYTKDHYETLGAQTYNLLKSGEREMSRHTTRTFKKCLSEETNEEHRALAQEDFTQGYRMARIG